MKRFIKILIIILLIVGVVFAGYKAYEIFFGGREKPINSPESNESTAKNAIEWYFIGIENEDVDTYLESQPKQMKKAIDNKEFKKYVKALVERGNEIYGDEIEIEIDKKMDKLSEKMMDSIYEDVNEVYGDIFDEFDIEFDEISIDEAYRVNIDIKGKSKNAESKSMKIIVFNTHDGEWIVWQDAETLYGSVKEYDYYQYVDDYDLD